MTRTSGHTPTQRLVPRHTPPAQDPDLFSALADQDDDDPIARWIRDHPAEPKTIAARFERWITDNPQVLHDFVEAARALKAAGRERAGAKMICEVLRYNTEIKGDDGGYKLNNVYISHLVRLAEDLYPELDGLFEKRALATEKRAS